MYPRGGVGSTARPNETEVTSRYFTGMIGICMLRIKMTEREALADEFAVGSRCNRRCCRRYPRGVSAQGRQLGLN